MGRKAYRDQITPARRIRVVVTSVAFRPVLVPRTRAVGDRIVRCGFLPDPEDRRDNIGFPRELVHRCGRLGPRFRRRRENSWPGTQRLGRLAGRRWRNKRRNDRKQHRGYLWNNSWFHRKAKPEAQRWKCLLMIRIPAPFCGPPGVVSSVNPDAPHHWSTICARNRPAFPQKSTSWRAAHVTRNANLVRSLCRSDILVA